MNNYEVVIRDYIDRVSNENDKRIMRTALKILQLEPIITDEEIMTFKQIFMALKDDYTLSITKDRQTLEFIVLISKQELPIIENVHDVEVLCSNLMSIDSHPSKIEDAILTFFDACEHVEENEVLVINRLVDSISNNWTLKPIESKEENGNLIRFSRFVPNSTRRLIKNRS